MGKLVSGALKTSVTTELYFIVCEKKILTKCVRRPFTIKCSYQSTIKGEKTQVPINPSYRAAVSDKSKFIFNHSTTL